MREIQPAAARLRARGMLVDQVQFQDYSGLVMTMVNVHEAKTQLSRLLERVHAGEEIVIAKAGRPCARLMPLEPPPERVLGRYRDRDGDVPDSVFEPLTGAELAAWEGDG